MYLKVDIDGSEQLYSFENQKTVIIGRAPSADIQIVTDGISRKHLKVIEREGEYFVVDLGSTNGTFLNEERLSLNEEHSFNSFFPLKLGFHVFLYLVDEVSPEQLNQAVVGSSAVNEGVDHKSDATVKINLNNLNLNTNRTSTNPKPSGIRSSNRSVHPRRSTNKKKKVKIEDQPNYLLYFAVCLIATGALAYSQGFLDSFFKSDKSMPKMVKTNSQLKPVQTSESNAVNELAKTKVNAIPSQEDLSNKMLLDKCLSDSERQLCDLFKNSYDKAFNEGFSIIVDSAYYILNFDKLIQLHLERELSHDEKEKLVILARDSMGRRFNESEFRKNNFKLDLKSIIVDEKFILKLLILDIFSNNYLKILNSNNISEIIFIGFKAKNIKQAYVYARFSKEILTNLSQNPEVIEAAKFSLLSGFDKVFQRNLIKNKKFNLNDLLEHIKLF